MVCNSVMPSSDSLHSAFSFNCFYLAATISLNSGSSPSFASLSSLLITSSFGGNGLSEYGPGMFLSINTL